MRGVSRSAPADSFRRGILQVARATISKISDKPLMQELDLNLHHDETKTQVERFQQYGLSTVPLSPSGNKFAEAIIAFLGGNRSHGVVLAVDDRRHRPKDRKEGEVTLYDDQGQEMHLSRGGNTITGGPKKLPVTVVVGGASIKVEDGKITLKADTIILDGTVKLGGADANKPASMQGTVDSAGDADVSGFASKVLMK